jgi:peptide-methionine (S)-S-oxide reductase
MTPMISTQDRSANGGTARFIRHQLVAGLGLAAALLVTVGARWSSPDRIATPADATGGRITTGGASDQVAVLSGGCFWGLQAVYEHVIGVTGVTAGYAGGEASTATYDQVSEGTTGHAESVRIAFDPTKVSYADLLKVFFTVAHNPTELNRQGPDNGPQYRSAIWYLSPEQHKTADSVIHQLTVSKMFPQPIVTQVTMFKGFYAAEAYHQDYAVTHPNAPYIVYNDAPKVARLKKELPSLYRDTPVLFASGTAGQ